MTETLSSYRMVHRGNDRPARRLVCFQALSSCGGVLAAVLIGGAFGTPRSALTGEAVTPELPSIATIIGASAPQSCGRRAPAAVTQPSFAFGFLEFDWDPNAPGGVPGFDSWPKHDLRVAVVSPRH